MHFGLFRFFFRLKKLVNLYSSTLLLMTTLLVLLHKIPINSIEADRWNAKKWERFQEFSDLFECQFVRP